MSAEATDPIRRWQTPVRWIQLLSLVGLAIAGYLMTTYVRDESPYCAGSGGCETVQTSEYATIVDGLEIPTLGVLGYLIILALTSLRGRVNTRWAYYMPLLTYGAALIGFAYSAYLTYLEAAVINAWCYWCLASAAVMTLIFALAVIDLRRAWYT
jgi:uncharacterized membrane protein